MAFFYSYYAFMNASDPLRDWADIRLFLGIVDHGSLVGAADHLGLTQPTVGRRLAAMEERFGTPLFVRAGRRMQMTDAGHAILESARRMHREMHAIERSLDIQSSELCGEVTLSATEGTGTEWLTPVLRDFRARYPEILVKVLIEARAVDILRREADLALRLGSPAQESLIARKLVTVGFGLYASQRYVDSAPAPLPETVADLADHYLVGVDMNDPTLDTRLAFPSENPLPGRFAYLSNSPTGQVSAVREGMGIGLLSHRWAAMVGDLVPVLPGQTIEEIEMWLVTHEELRYSARIRVLFDYIAERFIEDKDLFAGPPVSTR
ncbi:MAG: LysR family transcriptional regulator [Pseudomonadota bacterium]